MRYADAGVDISRADQAKLRIRRLAGRTFTRQVLAEPGALIGFAGKRTIWNTVRLELPEGFQTSEFLMRHGFIDRIVPRKDLRTEVARIIDYCEH